MSENMEDNDQNLHTGHKKRRRHRKKLLHASILKQMEFYFSDAALSKDRFLSQLIHKDPFVPLEVFLRFNKIKALTTKESEIAVSLRDSKFLELSEDNLKVKRVTPCLPYDADARTVYVESIPVQANLQWLTSVFQAYGPVAYISLPKYYNTNRIKGFAFVEFEKEKDARKCLETFINMGCKLPTNIKAESLASCQGFQPDIPDNQPQSDVEQKITPNPSENKKNKTSDEPSVKRIRRDSKRQSHNQDNKDNKSESTLQDAENNDSKNQATEESATEQSESATEQDATTTEKVSQKKTKPVRKRKKKDRKKAHKEHEKQHLEMTARSLQLLSKCEWKVLRNKYLNLQRKHMKALKQVLRTQHTAPENRSKMPIILAPVYPEQPGDGDDFKVRSMPPEIPFVEGVIVLARLTEPCVDVKAFRRATKENIHVQFVDVKEGQSDVYIRTDEPDAAKQLASSGIFPEAHVLEGNEEKEYWEVLKKQRCEKATSKRKVRGRDRLLSKAQQLVESVGQATATVQPQGKHIRFDE